MASRSQADIDLMSASGLEAQSIIESGDAEDMGKWNMHLLGNTFQGFFGKIFFFSLYILENLNISKV
jgi:hypothetical protein